MKNNELSLAVSEKMDKKADADLQPMNTNIGNLKQNVRQLDNDVAELRVNSSTLKSSIEQLKANSTVFFTNIEKLKNNVTALRDDVTNLNTWPYDIYYKSRLHGRRG